MRVVSSTSLREMRPYLNCHDLAGLPDLLIPCIPRRQDTSRLWRPQPSPRRRMSSGLEACRGALDEGQRFDRPGTRRLPPPKADIFR